MKTPIEIVDDLHQFIKESSLQQALKTGGGVYKITRPTGSTKEDVVINCLPVPNTQLQLTIANVNLHVPDISISKNGTVTKVPDIKRLNELAVIAWDLLKENYENSEYHWELQQMTNPFEDEVAGSHYINIRIEFYSLNISN
jgi:hypothetical protein